LAKLRRESETYQAQTLFLQSVTSLDVKRLLSFHHEISLNASTVENYWKVLSVIREGGDAGGLSAYLERISLANRKIAAIAQFAIKANFKADTQKELTDVPAFVEQYIPNVAKEFVGSGIEFDVQNKVAGPFEIKIRRIELSILLDNIISNSGKAQARLMQIIMEMAAKNVLRLSFRDDGKGLADAISKPNDIFALGVTTTSGSGLGLYHVDQIVKSVRRFRGGISHKSERLEIRVEVSR